MWHLLSLGFLLINVNHCAHSEEHYDWATSNRTAVSEFMVLEELRIAWNPIEWLVLPFSFRRNRLYLSLQYFAMLFHALRMLWPCLIYSLSTTILIIGQAIVSARIQFNWTHSITMPVAGCTVWRKWAHNQDYIECQELPWDNSFQHWQAGVSRAIVLVQ